MFDLHLDDHTDRELLVHIMKELKAMALDLSKLNDAVAANSAATADMSAKVDGLIATHTDPAAQAAVDAAATHVASSTDVVKAVSAKVDAALSPPPPAPPPPPVV